MQPTYKTFHNLMQVDQKSRHYVFTWNTYPEDFRQQLANLGAVYLAYQPERGESGTRHLQGVVSFGNPRAFRAVARACTGWHIDKMRGTIDQAVAYCSKEETRDAEAGFGFTEEGTRPLSAGTVGGRSDLKQVTALVKAGAGIKRVADELPVSVILFSRGIERLIGLHREPRNHLTQVFWFYGPTGSGKSRAASDAEPGAYWKTPNSQWWDGYEYQEAVIIDDYRTDFCKFNELLRMCDRYPYQVQVKGGTREFTSLRLYITTPKNPRDTWSLRSDEDLGQLTRRITEVRHFPAMFAPAV